jgi:DHA2 family multidrug resistance protein-like MFS transporter
MLVLVIGVVMSQLDASIANLALPVIGREMNVSSGASIVVVNAYQIAVTVSLLPLAALGDIVGYRRVYLGGLALFTTASLACAMSDSLYALAAARMFQGLGAAGLMSVNTTLIRESHPESMLGRALGVTAMVIATSSALGPGVAASILSLANWPWLFLVNVPLGLFAALVGFVCLPPNRTTARRLDMPSIALNAVTFGIFVLGINRAGHVQNSEGFPYTLLCAALAATFGILLVRRQLGQSEPMLPLDLLRTPPVGLSVAASSAAFVAQSAALVALPFFMRDALGLGVAATGARMMAWPFATALVAPLVGYLFDRHPRYLSAGIAGGVGLCAVAAGLTLVTLARPQTSTIVFDCFMVLCGAGFACFTAPNLRTIISCTPRSRGGAVGGMIATTRMTGQTVGAALAALQFNLFAQNGALIALRMAAVSALLAAALSSMRRRGRKGNWPVQVKGTDRDGLRDPTFANTAPHLSSPGEDKRNGISPKSESRTSKVSHSCRQRG